SSEENPGSAARRARRGLSDPRFTHETGDETSEPRFQRASAWVPCLQRTAPRSAKAWAAKAGARQTNRYLHRPRDRVTRRLPNCRRSIHSPAPTVGIDFQICGDLTHSLRLFETRSRPRFLAATLAT